MGRPPFQMADGRAGDAADPRVLDLPALVFAVGRFRQLRLPNSGPRLRRAPEFPAGPGRPIGLVVAWSHDRSIRDRGRHRIRTGARPRARDGENLQGTRDRHVDPHHPAVYQPGHRRSVLGAVPAKALRPRGLPLEPAAPSSSGYQLGRRNAVGLYLDRPRRRLAMDPVHVRHPARRTRGHSPASLRGGGARRRRRSPDVSLCDHAAAGAGDAACRHASASWTPSSFSTSSSC